MPRILFHSFSMGDVEDPDHHASILLNTFMSTEKGQWISDNCPQAEYMIAQDQFNWGLRVSVQGEVEDKLATEYYLKWG
jgi:hypothetical protein